MVPDMLGSKRTCNYSLELYGRFSWYSTLADIERFPDLVGSAGMFGA